jgi:hypothetical protein
VALISRCNIQKIVSVDVDDPRPPQVDYPRRPSIGAVGVAVQKDLRVVGMDEIGESGEAAVSAVRGIEADPPSGLAGVERGRPDPSGVDTEPVGQGAVARWGMGDDEINPAGEQDPGPQEEQAQGHHPFVVLVRAVVVPRGTPDTEDAQAAPDHQTTVDRLTSLRGSLEVGAIMVPGHVEERNIEARYQVGQVGGRQVAAGNDKLHLRRVPARGVEVIIERGVDLVANRQDPCDGWAPTSSVGMERIPPVAVTLGYPAPGRDSRAASPARRR